MLPKYSLASNDPVGEWSGEAIYLRDEHSTQVWGATPGPLPRARSGGRWVTRHGAGATHYAHHQDGITCAVTVFVHKDEPLKFTRVSLHNHGTRHAASACPLITSGRFARPGRVNTSSSSPNRTPAVAQCSRATPTTLTSPGALHSPTPACR
jgi:hypothetical protein